jgi:uncharacterized protein
MEEDSMRTNHLWLKRVAGVGLILMMGAAQAASFDCAKAQSKVEHLICDNPEISKLDEEIGKAYPQALERSADKPKATKEQRRWLKEVRNGCADVGCLKAAYQARIEELTDTQEHAEASSQLKLLKGKGVEVCEIYKKNLDALGRSDLSCERNVSPEYEQIIKKPEWKSLDIWENRNLMALAGKFLDYGDTARKDTVYDDKTDIDNTARTQLGLKGVTMMTAPIDIDNDGVAEKILRFQNGICGIARFSYTTAILVLDKESNTVDAKKSQLLYPDSWLNPKTGEKKQTRDYHYITYGIFSFLNKTYFDRMHFDGLLEVYKVSNGSNEEVCKFKTIK